MPRVPGVPDDRTDLCVAAQLVHAFGFRELALDTSTLGYEPRWSCQCRQPGCTAVWVGSKSGDVMHLALPIGNRKLKQRRLRGGSEARALCHVHEGTALGIGSCLLIGRDSGALDIVRDDHPDWEDWSSAVAEQTRRSPATPRPSFHLDSWWARGAGDQPAVAVDRGVPRSDSHSTPTRGGITAIAVVEQPDERDRLRIVVATRSLQLYLIEAGRRGLSLVQRISMPGWIQWIIGPQRDHPFVICISRGGDIVRLLFRGGRLAVDDRKELSILPTAAMPFGDRSLLLGTTTGLVLVDDDHPEGIGVPVTRSAVLCLDDAKMKDGAQIHRYVTMGLEDGRLRVADVALLQALARGTRREPPHDHNFAFDLPSAVLAVETLQLGTSSSDTERTSASSDPEPSDTAYVLAVLRDHSMRLFQVISQQAQREAVERHWAPHVARAVARAGSPSVGELGDGLLAAGEPAPDDCRDAWSYMLVDVVLPKLGGLAMKISLDEQRRIVRLACQIAKGADRRVLSRLSLALRELTNDVGLQLELSRAILGAVPHHDDRRWEAFIDNHLRELHALARVASLEDDRTRLAAWARFVRKFIRRGNTFSAKRTGLFDLVKQNEQAGKKFDALVYLARLSQRCYDLRWERNVAAEVFEIHTVDFDARRETHAGDGSPRRTVVVVVTIDARLLFLDGVSGHPLVCEPEASGRHRAPNAVVEPFLERGAARTLASAAVREGTLLRIVLSGTGPLLRSPGLAVVDLDVQWSADAMFPTLRYERPLIVPKMNEHAFIHALRPLPDRTDAFVVGLATRERPVGLFWRDAGLWRLEIATDDFEERARKRKNLDEKPETHSHESESAGRSFDQSSLAPGKIPTGAVAVAAVGPGTTSYLVVAGSDDGLVRAISFAYGTRADQWQIDRWDQVADPVTSVALARHAEGSGDLFSCYVGTVAGDVFALSLPRTRANTPTSEPFANYEAQPLWRESHDGPILAMELWPTPLYRTDDGTADEVLVVVTEKGRLCFYQHSHRGKERLAASSNYYHRGMRFDRIAMADRLKALALVDDDRELVAAGPGGHIYKGALLYLRESAPNTVCPPEPTSASHVPQGPDSQQPYYELGHELWIHLDLLFKESTLHEQFSRNEPCPDKLKLELCDLVRLEGGALSAYALRRRLLFHEPWDRAPRTAAEMREEARQRLHPLKPEIPEDAEQIKVILKSLCRTFLYRDLNELRDEIVRGVGSSADGSKTAAACKVVSDYLTREVGYATAAAARLRVVAIKELLCVPVLRHIACDDPEHKTRHAVTSALAACLRDDDRLVRIEALRSVSVMLRNVGVMADAAADRAEFIKAMFPHDLGSVTWLLELLVGGLRRFPGFTRRTALVSGAWYLIKALLPLFRIFNHRTLALCEHLLREGLDVEVLALCLRSLRGRNTGALRNRIEYFYLPKDSKDAFIKAYHKQGEDRWNWLDLSPPEIAATAPGQLPAGSWHEIDDATIAHRLSYLLDQLAAMWKVDSLRELGEIRRITLTSGAAVLESLVADLTSVADDLTRRHADGLLHLARFPGGHEASLRRGAPIAAPIQNIVRSILVEWDRCCDSTPYSTPLVRGREIGKYRLGELIADDRFEGLFELEAPPEVQGTHVIKVLRRMNAAEQFLDRARRNHELSELSKHIVNVVDIHEGPPPAYVMPKYQVLKNHLNSAQGGQSPSKNVQSSFQHREDTWQWVEQVASHIADALRIAHARDRSHGDVTPANILFSGQGDDRRFYLRDFGAIGAFDDPIGGPSGRGGLVPEYLSKKDARTGEDGRRPWDDVTALLLILYHMLTGVTVSLHNPEEARHLTNIDELSRNPRFAHQPCRSIIGMLRRLLDHSQSSGFSISQFISEITPRS
jgi:hypothetical protein